MRPRRLRPGAAAALLLLLLAALTGAVPRKGETAGGQTLGLNLRIWVGGQDAAPAQRAPQQTRKDAHTSFQKMDPYRTLGVSRDASMGPILEKWGRHAEGLRRDAWDKGHAEASKKAEAFQLLIDPVRRGRYDSDGLLLSPLEAHQKMFRAMFPRQGAGAEALALYTDHAQLRRALGPAARLAILFVSSECAECKEAAAAWTRVAVRAQGAFTVAAASCDVLYPECRLLGVDPAFLPAVSFVRGPVSDLYRGDGFGFANLLRVSAAALLPEAAAAIENFDPASFTAPTPRKSAEGEDEPPPMTIVIFEHGDAKCPVCAAELLIAVERLRTHARRVDQQPRHFLRINCLVHVDFCNHNAPVVEVKDDASVAISEDTPSRMAWPVAAGRPPEKKERMLELTCWLETLGAPRRWRATDIVRFALLDSSVVCLRSESDETVQLDSATADIVCDGPKWLPWVLPSPRQLAVEIPSAPFLNGTYTRRNSAWGKECLIWDGPGRFALFTNRQGQWVFGDEQGMREGAGWVISIAAGEQSPELPGEWHYWNGSVWNPVYTNVTAAGPPAEFEDDCWAVVLADRSARSLALLSDWELAARELSGQMHLAVLHCSSKDTEQNWKQRAACQSVAGNLTVATPEVRLWPQGLAAKRRRPFSLSVAALGPPEIVSLLRRSCALGAVPSLTPEEGWTVPPVNRLILWNGGASCAACVIAQDVFYRAVREIHSKLSHLSGYEVHCEHYQSESCKGAGHGVERFPTIIFHHSSGAKRVYKAATYFVDEVVQWAVEEDRSLLRQWGPEITALAARPTEPMLVLYTAGFWCTPCAPLEEVWREVAHMLQPLAVGVVECDKGPRAQQHCLDVRAAVQPTVVLYAPGTKAVVLITDTVHNAAAAAALVRAKLPDFPFAADQGPLPQLARPARTGHGAVPAGVLHMSPDHYRAALHSLSAVIALWVGGRFTAVARSEAYQAFVEAVTVLADESPATIAAGAVDCDKHVEFGRSVAGPVADHRSKRFHLPVVTLHFGSGGGNVVRRMPRSGGLSPMAVADWALRELRRTLLRRPDPSLLSSLSRQADHMGGRAARSTRDAGARHGWEGQSEDALDAHVEL
eukprot:TRINITY_DN55442_c0_g1_i1.p1 TRINITY_DN55442_c0_g1~~TRINITY_DN55442_c0_g1_i1.p1  ORF type:complete len:1098 (+),score=253.12 TRINITY_DN55442_c0_g1_i1:114-3407(+)